VTSNLSPTTTIAKAIVKGTHAISAGGGAAGVGAGTTAGVSNVGSSSAAGDGGGAGAGSGVGAGGGSTGGGGTGYLRTGTGRALSARELVQKALVPLAGLSVLTMSALMRQQHVWRTAATAAAASAAVNANIGVPSASVTGDAATAVVRENLGCFSSGYGGGGVDLDIVAEFGLNSTFTAGFVGAAAEDGEDSVRAVVLVQSSNTLRAAEMRSALRNSPWPARGGGAGLERRFVIPYVSEQGEEDVRAEAREYGDLLLDMGAPSSERYQRDEQARRALSWAIAAGSSAKKGKEGATAWDWAVWVDEGVWVHGVRLLEEVKSRGRVERGWWGARVG
jgi:hypothetical protein